MTTTTEKQWDIEAIETANRVAGFHFFDRATMRFFDSRILEDVFQGPGGIYFVTSEKFRGLHSPDGPRLYTVRKFHPATGTCATFPSHTDGWQAFKSGSTAKRYARIYSQDPKNATTEGEG